MTRSVQFCVTMTLVVQLYRTLLVLLQAETFGPGKAESMYLKVVEFLHCVLLWRSVL